MSSVKIMCHSAVQLAQVCSHSATVTPLLPGAPLTLPSREVWRSVTPQVQRQRRSRVCGTHPACICSSTTWLRPSHQIGMARPFVSLSRLPKCTQHCQAAPVVQGSCSPPLQDIQQPCWECPWQCCIALPKSASGILHADAPFESCQAAPGSLMLR